MPKPKVIRYAVVGLGYFAQAAVLPAFARLKNAKLTALVSGDKKKQVEDAIAAVREAINRNDTDAMKRTYDDLQNKFQEVSAELYKQASAGAGAQAGPQPEAQPRPGAEQGAGARGSAEGGSDVVDAEFEVVDEDKKK